MPLAWDKFSLRYRDLETGRYLPRIAVIEARNDIVRAVTKELTALTNQLRDRQITLAQWQVGMKDSLRAGHTLAAGIAGGGKANMSFRDWGRVGAQLREQYKYLNRFAQQIENGAPVSLGRVRMYANAIRSTFVNAEKVAQKEIGTERVRWVLTARESCQGCIAAEGEWDIDECPVIGSHSCLSNCKCFLEYL